MSANHTSGEPHSHFAGFEHEEIERQYARVLTEAREEIKEFYWFFNFGFVINSALVAFHFMRGTNIVELHLLLVGIVTAIYWALFLHFQKKWKYAFHRKVQLFETQLKYKGHFRIWIKPDEVLASEYDHLRGLTVLLYALPFATVGYWVFFLGKLLLHL